MTDLAITDSVFRPDGANETDVREEYLSQVLNGLGYRRGTENDIFTEFPLSYDRVTLGRRKPNDPSLKGKADYLLKAGTSARWVLEAKAPNPIRIQDVDQVLSYARHPEISATYAAICNGREFRVYSSNQFSDQAPLLSFSVTSPSDAIESLASMLHPECIKRQSKQRRVSGLRPIAEGRSADEIVSGGFSRVLEVDWRSRWELNNDERFNLEAMVDKLVGTENTISGGSISRNPDGDLVAIVDWAAPHYHLHDFMERKALNRHPIICLSDQISRDAENPTYFDAVQEIDLFEGESSFNIFSWQEEAIQVDAKMSNIFQVMGILQGDLFVGFTNSLLLCLDPDDGETLLEIKTLSSLEVYLAD